MKRKIETQNAPAAIGPYSQGIISPSLIFTSGQLPIDPATGEMPADAASQARQSLKNCQAVIEAAGGHMTHVLKTTVFIKNMADFATINEVYEKFFESPFPARSCVEVAQLPKGALVEIECIAYTEPAHC